MRIRWPWGNRKKSHKFHRTAQGSFGARLSDFRKRGNVSRFAKARDERRRLYYQQQIRKWRSIFLRYRILLITICIFFAIITCGAFVAHYLGENETFLLKEIQIVGNQEIQDLAILSKLTDVEGKSMFAFNTADLEYRLRTEFPYIKEVYIRKLLPSTLFVEIEERYPLFSYVNLTGAYQIDSEGVVLSVIFSDAGYKLLNYEEILLVTGGSPNADFVKTYFENKQEDLDESEQRSWDELSSEERSGVLEEMRNQLNSKVEMRLQENKVRNLAFSDSSLPVVEDVKIGEYEVSSSFDTTKLNICKSVINYLTKLSQPWGRLYWESEFTFHAELTSGTVILFTGTKDIKRQLLGLESIRVTPNFRNAKIVDLRSELISIKY